MNRDRTVSEKLIKCLGSVGFRAIILTVDAAVPGKRERDQRAKGDFSVSVNSSRDSENLLCTIDWIYD